MAEATASTLPGVRGLFQQRLSGDDALLRLAERRFRETGMPAEVYADNPDQLEYLLGYIPEHDTCRSSISADPPISCARPDVI